MSYDPCEQCGKDPFHECECVRSPVCPCCATLVPGEDVCPECSPDGAWRAPCDKHDDRYLSDAVAKALKKDTHS